MEERLLFNKDSSNGQNDNHGKSYASLGLLDKLFFAWCYPLIKYSNENQLREENLYEIDSSNLSQVYSREFNQFWKESDDKGKSNQYRLLTTILRANKTRCFILVFLSVVSTIMELLTVYFLELIINYFQGEVLLFEFWVYALTFLLTKFTNILLNRQIVFLQECFGNKTTSQLMSVVFSKILTTSPFDADKKAPNGEVLNFIQIDSIKIYDAIILTPTLITAPLQILGYNYYLFQLFSFTYLYGFFTLVFLLYLNYIYQKKQVSITEELLANKDRRVSLTSETFGNIRLLKLYGWEKEYKNKIIEAMTEEGKALIKSLIIDVVVIFLLWLAPMLVSIITIGVYSNENQQLDISKILICITIFNMISFPLNTFPEAVTKAIQVVVSLNRIQKYLDQDDINEVIISKSPNNKTENSIKIQNCNFSWFANSSNVDEKTEGRCLSNIEMSFLNQGGPKEKTKIGTFSLKNINIEIRRGEFIGIIGKVGSGKSSLLESVLNNLHIKNHIVNLPKLVEINGSLSYSSQEPWIQNNTIKNNILFYKEYDDILYKEIIKACQLQTDLLLLSHGDETEIGHKGINLSGGQKSRVNLARALYADADIYLMDDPLASLDAAVGEKIMKESILKFLRNKTRVLVTNSIHYLHYMDRIIYLDNGEIIWEGLYENLVKQSFYEEYKSEFNNLGNIKKHINQTDKEIKERESVKDHFNNTIGDNRCEQVTKPEYMESGSVKSGVYFRYFQYFGGKKILFSITFIMFLWQLLKVLSDLWLAKWTNQSLTEPNHNRKNFILYTVLGLGSTLFILARLVLISYGGYNITINLHKDMIDKLIGASITLFHDRTPKGQIINRLTGDLDEIFENTYNLGGIFAFVFSILGVVFICAYFEAYSLMFSPILLVIGYVIFKLFIKAGQDVRRLNAISKSSILNMVEETLRGSTVIRAYGNSKRIIEGFHMRLNSFLKINFNVNGINHWFGTSLDMLSFLFIAFMIILALIFKESFTPQGIGLILTYALNLQFLLLNLFIEFGPFTSRMVYMERCLEFTAIQQENIDEKLAIENKTLRNWPGKGFIKFANYSVRYRPDSEIVLKNLNFEIKEKEKIGVVGRTGSGKSTICLSLFKVLESSTGSITIDDIDLSRIEHNYLRQKLTIIPQDPMLTKGSLRYNIDPLSKYSDSEINEVTSTIGLWEIISEARLDKQIEEHGSNLSAGEKQLISIVRAILRKSKIVVMDEATANIDFGTEKIMQKCFSKYFKDSTVITIAHRIKTIINYDKILVLKNGEIDDFDTPENLLRNKESLFYQLYSMHA